MANTQKISQGNRRHWIIAFTLAVALYVIVPQLGAFKSSWHSLNKLNTGWLLVAGLLTLMTYLAAAATYYFLAFKRLRYSQLVLIEVAAMFINRLLPAGIGALGTNYSYLRQRGHSQAQSATMVAANNLIGVIGHFMLLLLVVTVSTDEVRLSQLWHGVSTNQFFVLTAALAAILVFLWFRLGSRRIGRTILSLRKPLQSYGRHPGKLALALCTSLILTSCNVLCLLACGRALGVHLALMAVLLIFSLGAAAGTVTPTPGGLGGFEAGLFAGLAAYGTAAPLALTIALLYRLVSYWLPLILGALAFLIAQREGLFLN